VPVLGIDIGTSAIKAAVIAANSAGVELISWALERIEGGDVKAALSAVLKRIPFTSQVPVTSVSGKGTLIRYIDMPRMPLEDLRKSFVYDIDKYFPFDPQTIYTDCFILDRQNKDKRMSVLVAAVKKEIVDERIKLFKEAGMELSYITINSIATANAFERLGPAAAPKTGAAIGAAKAILDLGGAVSNILVIKDLSPCFTRDIFIGSQEITKQIANILGVDAAQADGLKCGPGERSAEVMSSCETALSQLVSEIRLSLDYFMTEKNIQVDEFFLLGGGSLLKGIEAVFEKNLGMPVRAWDPLSGLRLGPSIAASGVQAFSAQLGVAAGLGLAKI
ncbi:MAG: type IV pilus assembly protein PilM, partial [Candidatus Omnitrophica bacterium]|nr:type IV pilus assembly protein PilM [Candidatus Omnitrophota bacterium]